MPRDGNGHDWRRHVSDILADEMEGGKVLIFAHHRNVLDSLERGVLQGSGAEYIRIDGRTKARSRACWGLYFEVESCGLPVCRAYLVSCQMLRLWENGAPPPGFLSQSIAV